MARYRCVRSVGRVIHPLEANRSGYYVTTNDKGIIVVPVELVNSKDVATAFRAAGVH